MKKLLLITLTAVLCAGIYFLNNCSKSKSDEKTLIKIAFWGDFNELNAINDIAKKIEKEIPRVKLKLEHIPVGGDASRYSQKILTEAASDTAPDIAFCDVNLFVSFYTKGLFISLTPYLRQDQNFSIKNYFPSLVKRFTVNKEVYILPRDVAPFAVVYYNKDLFDKAGLAYPKDNWTIDDLLRYAKALTKYDEKGLPVQFGFYTWVWQNFVYCYGGGFVDDPANPRKCILDKKESIQGLQFYIDLMYKHHVMPLPSSLESGTQELFKTGKLAMYCSGIWETPAMKQGNSFQWDIVMFPKGPGGKRGFATGGSGYGILKWAKDKDLAWQVLKYLASPEAQKHLAIKEIAQPADIKLAESEVWAQAKQPPYNKKMLNQAVNYIIFEPFTPKWNFISKNILSTYLDPIFLHNKEVKSKLKQAAKAITEKLQEEEK